MIKFLENEKLDYLIILFVFIVYQLTLAPSIIQIDCGELAAVQYTFGIAHPSGYPLFTILGYIFGLIPLPISKIYQYNILASLYTSFAVFFLIKTFRVILTKPYFFTKQKNIKSKKNYVQHTFISLNKLQISLLSICGGLIAAFSKTFWFQSTSVEVYSLHLLLLSIILYQSFLIANNEITTRKDWLKLAFFIALGFGNHLTTFLILPALAYLFIKKEGINKNSLITFSLSSLIFILTFVLLYSVLVVRALSKPLINWGNPINLENLIRHISGFQYQVWMFSSSEAAKKQLIYFITNLPAEFAYLSFIIGLIGILTTAKLLKHNYVFILIFFISTIIYSINYDINDIDSYFLGAFISFSFLVVFALTKFLQNYLQDNTKFELIFILPLFQLIFNFNNINQSGNFSINDYTNSILKDSEKNAMIISYQWDFFVSPFYYYRYVENKRPDLIVIDKELLRRSWYYNQLEVNYKNIFKNLELDVKEFKKALVPFERKENYDPNKLEYHYRRIIKGLIENSLKANRPVYLGPEIIDNEIRNNQLDLPDGIQILPEGFLYRVVKDSAYVPQKNYDVNIRYSENLDKYSTNLRDIIFGMMVNRAIYEKQHKKLDKVELILNKINKLYPDKALPEMLIK